MLTGHSLDPSPNSSCAARGTGCSPNSASYPIRGLAEGHEPIRIPSGSPGFGSMPAGIVGTSI